MNLEELIGTTIGQYLVKKVIRGTSKTVTLEGEETETLSPRKVAIKVLRTDQPYERREQIRKEVERLKKLKHPNITTMYNSGEDKGLYYIVMELVEGKDLDEEIKSGKRFSLEETVTLIKEVGQTTQYIYDTLGSGHNDIKTKNIKMKRGSGHLDKAFVLDFGGRIRETDTTDVQHIGKVLETLIDHRENPERKVPRKLKRIMKHAKKGNYASPQEIVDALETYEMSREKVEFIKGTKIPITRSGRRKVLSVSGLSLAVCALSSGTQYTINHIQSRRLGDTLNEIRSTKETDYNRLAELFIKLGKRICYDKIEKIYSDIRVRRGFYPYATTKEGKWFTTASHFISVGFSYEILRAAGHITEEKEFERKAETLREKIRYEEGSERKFNPARLLHARKDILKAARYFDRFYNENHGFYDFGQLLGVNTSSQEAVLDTGSLTGPLSVIKEAAYLGENEESNRYKRQIVRHTGAIERFMMRKDNSTIDYAIINFAKEEVHQRRRKAFAHYGCYSRGHAGTIDWFVDMYAATQNEHYRNVATRLQNYFTKHLPKDGIPFADLHPEYRQRKGAYRDTSALTKNIHTRAKQVYIHGEREHMQPLYTSLQDLVPYIPGNEEPNIIINCGCVNLNTKEYANSCPIWSVHSFLKTIEIIKKNHKENPYNVSQGSG